MFFRNLFFFRFGEGVIASPDAFERALDSHRLREIGPLELATNGFVSPIGRDDDALALIQERAALFAVGTYEKLLPSAVVAEELAHRIAQLVDREGRRPGAKERKRMKEEIISEFLPRAFVRYSRTFAYIDLDGGWLVIDTSSRRAAEDVVSRIREALGRFPCTPLAPEESPRNLMTGWLIDRMPAGFVLGEECELRDPAEAGAIVRCRRQDLESDEVREHLRSGKQVFQLGAVFDDRVSFVLGEDLVVRKLRFLDVVLDQLGDSSQESVRAEIDATFALMRLELRAVLVRLVELFKLPAPGKEKLVIDGGDAPMEMRDAARAPNANDHTEASRGEFTRAMRARGMRVQLVSDPIEVSLDNLCNANADAIAWLQSGERGASSEAMFHRFTFGEKSTATAHPADPADLRRCRLLLERVPAFDARRGELAAISPTWAKIIERWDDLCDTMDVECDWRSGKGSAPKTFDLMQQLGC